MSAIDFLVKDDSSTNAVFPNFSISGVFVLTLNTTFQKKLYSPKY